MYICIYTYIYLFIYFGLTPSPALGLAPQWTSTSIVKSNILSNTGLLSRTRARVPIAPRVRPFRGLTFSWLDTLYRNRNTIYTTGLGSRTRARVPIAPRVRPFRTAHSPSCLDSPMALALATSADRHFYSTHIICIYHNNNYVGSIFFRSRQPCSLTSNTGGRGGLGFAAGVDSRHVRQSALLLDAQYICI